MLLLIASITCPEERDLLTEFHNTKLAMLYSEAGKHISGQENIEDVVYEAFARIIEKIDVFKQLKPKQRDRYAVVTVRNLCYLHLRKVKPFSFVSFDELLETADTSEDNDPESVTEQNIFIEQMHKILSQLKPESRMLLEQKYILQWTDIEMAQLYGIKSQSMRMKLTRARNELFKLMQEHNFLVNNSIIL